MYAIRSYYDDFPMVYRRMELNNINPNRANIDNEAPLAKSAEKNEARRLIRLFINNCIYLIGKTIKNFPDKQKAGEYP